MKTCRIVKDDLENHYQYVDAVRTVWVQIAREDFSRFAYELVRSTRYYSDKKRDRRQKKVKALLEAESAFLDAAAKYARAIEALENDQ